MATPQEEMTSLEVVKLIEAEADEEGDILEELSNQDIKEIYQQLNQQDKKRFSAIQEVSSPIFWGVQGAPALLPHGMTGGERSNAGATKHLGGCYCRKASRAPGRRPFEGIM